jgi:two-component system OmpR family sensor kinase
MITRRLSVRARLTLGSSILALVLLTAAVILARGQVAALLEQSDTDLATNDLTPFAADITVNAGQHIDQPGAGVLVEVRNPHGQDVQNTLSDELRERVAHATGNGTVIHITINEVPYALVGRTVAAPDGTWQLWAARSGAARALAEAGLDRIFIIGGGILMLAFVIASWLLARAALRPVERMRRRASELGEGIDDGIDNELLPVDPSGDELAQLATTLNAFLHNIRTSVDREKQMVSDAAHELRTPLAALRTQLELAHDDFDDADALRSEILDAEVSVARLSSLASNLLELARLEQSAPTGPSTDEEVLGELGMAIDRARLLAVPKDATIAYDSALVAGEVFTIDRTSLGRILDNLLGNAVTAISSRGTIDVNLTSDRAWLTISVRDNGPGVPDAFLPRAFDRFSRPDDARSTRGGGSGLGLALVRAVARGAGGDAVIRNLHPGLEVVVTIPRM